MSRKARQESATSVYHVINRGHNKEHIFIETDDKQFLLKLMRRELINTSIEVYAYCVMNNHFHLMVKSELYELSQFIKKILSEYALYFNQKYHRTGSVFQDRFKSECIETESYFWCCLRYIHNNPVKIHLVRKSYLYPFSSAKEYRDKRYVFLSKHALTMCESRFTDDPAFWRFHSFGEERLFIDMPDEMELNRTEVVRTIINKYLQTNEIKRLEQIVADPGEKKQLISEIKKKTQLSIAAIKRVLKILVQKGTEANEKGTVPN